ncbi:hypothetical protein ASE03_23595 [Kitasatospora sp. Root187]|nr:hypothetical protein ASE03_23595 [Kitasatospora sp. Root187]
MAYLSSWILRPSVLRWASSTAAVSSPACSTWTFFTYCWVRVEAPCTAAPLPAFLPIARSTPLGSTAPCS